MDEGKYNVIVNGKTLSAANARTLAAAKATRGQSPADAAVEGAVTKVVEVLGNPHGLPWTVEKGLRNARVCAIVNNRGTMLHSTDDLDLARFIVRAVNSHAGLCSALQEWVDYFNRLDRAMEPGDPVGRIRNDVHGPRLARARAALTTVKENA